MQTFKLKQSSEQEYYTEAILQQQDWLEILPNVEKKHPRQYEALLMFLRQQDHTSSCIALAREYSISVSTINSLITNFGRFVIKEHGYTFRIEQSDTKDDCFWPVAMLGKNQKTIFEWTLRPELVNALQDYLLEKLLLCYEKRILNGGLDNNESKELYKWKLIASCRRQGTEEILNRLCATNLIDNRYDGAAIKKLLLSDRNDLVKAFDCLRENDWDVSYENFKRKVDQLTANKFKYKISDERMAAAFSACCSPDKYTFYKSDLYSVFCSYLGVAKKSAGEKYRHYLSLLPMIIGKENKHEDLINKLHVETDSFIWSELLNAQDVLWQMQGFMKDSLPKNWLQKIYDDAIAANHWVCTKWYPEYKKSIVRFHEMFDDGKTAADADDETIEYLIRTPENYVSSNTQGCYTYEEYKEIKKKWPEIFEILQRNVRRRSIDQDDYDALAKLLRSLTSKNKNAAHHRIWAALFPEYLSTVITSTKFFDTYGKIRKIDDSLPMSTGRWLQDNIAIQKYINKKVEFKESEHSSLLLWLLYEKLSSKTADINIMDKYIKLLTANHNLILTGAPGTGKTYLAKEIARTMDAEYQLVQFHPSYDYTDFVEGLRPRKDMAGFERENGVFKNFCKRAALETTKKFVLIVDEINRGELSKIFGELFFSIDPGYRGFDENGCPKGLVQTQYQNMVESDDVFYEGFYVPDNVYILGTMNDIDRGVESMDFAIRRRFAWIEITADERASMLDDKEWTDLAKASMKALNKAIESKEVGLSSAYHIGPAYYLKLDQYDGDFESLWEYHIKGLLFEYLRGSRNIDYIINEVLKPAFDEYKNVNS